VQIFQVGLSIENGISEMLHVASTVVKLGDGKIKDIKFVDTHVMLVLWELAGKHKHLRLNMLYSLCYHRRNSSVEYPIPKFRSWPTKVSIFSVRSGK